MLSRTALPGNLDGFGWLWLIGLEVFLLSNFLPLPYQVTANLFYLFGAIPAILWCARHREIFVSWLRESWALWLFLLSIALAASLQGHPADSKPCLYVFLIGLVVLMLSNLDRRAIDVLFTGLAAVALGVVAWASYAWFQVYLASGEFQRIELWGSKHPINSALLVISAFVWFWEFKAGPAMQAKGKVVYFSAMLGFFLLVVWSTMPFQARSALLGFLVYLTLKMWLNQYRWHMVAGLLVVGALAWLTGLHMVLYERGFSYRPEIWADAWQRLSQECGFLLGCGKDGHMFAGRWTHAHSAYLMPLYEYGLLVMLPFALFALRLFRDGLRCKSRWLLVAAIGWGGVLTTTGGVVTSYKPFWIYFWIPTFMAMVECWRYKTGDGSIVRG